MKADDMFYSQFGEDKFLAEIFNNKTNGVCVEIGANDGINDSTSYFFEKLGWTSILIEPNPILCQKIREIRNSILYECAASSSDGTTLLYVAEGAERSHGVSTISNDKETHNRIKNYGFTTKPIQVNTRTLDNILIDAKLNSQIDFISIDVEGHELEVLNGFSIEMWKPTILIIEDNSNFEDTSVSDHLKELGYVKFMRTGVNDWYASKKNKELVNVKNMARYYMSAYKTRTKNKIKKIPLAVKSIALFKKIFDL